MSLVRFPLAPHTGRLDEWFSHWSAKPATAVRVRYRPLVNPRLTLFWLFVANAYRSLSSVGSERLPYKQRVGGSNPSATTRDFSLDFRMYFLQYVLTIVEITLKTCQSFYFDIFFRPFRKKLAKDFEVRNNLRIFAPTFA